ncbi:hypothetical protein H7J88_23265 [Mycolicibacterium flavescens]|uniref:hypothetical protein n=1 Tax=Mycolicibacterium flavescens TaxID=1776 RepID=UPI0013F4CDAF|nr:hypothetical protein [Mycolicibacterium flavescens]MCV7282559.1 hypothetical protein [Mycolicibacterium flavescens]
MAIATLVCVSLSLGWSLAGPVSYKAEGRVIISTSGSLSTGTDAFHGEQVSVERAPTYAQLLKGPEVAARASKRLHGDISAATIQDSVDARISSRLPMVIVSAQSPNANDAVQMVFAAEQGLQEYVTEIERRGRDGSLSSITLSGDPPTVARVGNPALNATLAALLGLVLGTMLAVYRDRTDPVVKSANQIGRLGLRYCGSITATENASALDDAFRRLAVGCVVSNQLDTKRVLVVGVDRGFETCFIARGLAGGLAACGRRTTLVNAITGNRRETGFGLSDVLNGSRTWTECIHRTGTDHLLEMGVGTESTSLDALLIDSRNENGRVPRGDRDEHLVIGGPSIAHSSTAVALTAIADSALIVVTEGESLVSDVLEAKLILEAMDTPIIGMVYVIGAPLHDRDDSNVLAEVVHGASGPHTTSNSSHPRPVSPSDAS